MRLFQGPLDTCLDSPFFASLSVHGLHFTVYAASRFRSQGFRKQGFRKLGIPKVGKTHTGNLLETEISKARDSEVRDSGDRDSESRDSEDSDSESRGSEAGDSENGQIQAPLNSDTPYPWGRLDYICNSKTNKSVSVSVVFWKLI